MKKSTGAILIIIIVLLLGAVGVGGFFLIKGNIDSNKAIGELTNAIAGSNENTTTNSATTNTTTTNAITENTTASNKTVKTMKDVAGNYKYEIKDDNGYVFGTNLYLSEDGTFGCYFDVGGITGSYSIDGNQITLNEIFSHGGGVGLDIEKKKRVLTIEDDGSIKTKDFKGIEKQPEEITLLKVSDSVGDWDIRTSIKGSIGNGPEYQFKYNY